jgi:hypothetical protein
LLERSAISDAPRWLRACRIFQYHRFADATSKVAGRLFLRATFRRYSFNPLLVVRRLLSAPAKFRLDIDGRLFQQRSRRADDDQILAQRPRNSRPDSGRVQSGIVKTSAQAAGRRTQSGEILRIKGAKRGVDRVPDADNSFFHGRTQERNPKLTAKEQLRPTRRRGTDRMRRAVTFHPFHRYRCWIEDLVFIWTKPVDLFHPTLRTRIYPRLDVGLMEKSLRRLVSHRPAIWFARSRNPISAGGLSCIVQVQRV